MLYRNSFHNIKICVLTIISLGIFQQQGKGYVKDLSSENKIRKKEFS